MGVRFLWIKFILCLVFSIAGAFAFADDAPPPLTVLNSEFSAAVSWTFDPDDGQDVLRGYVQYAPQTTSPTCQSLRMVQIARVEVTPGKDLQWTTPEQNRNLMRTTANSKTGVVAGYFVDHASVHCAKGKPCSPYYRDSWANADESQDGENDSAAQKIASSVDYPSGWTEFQTISLETCARCVDSSQFLGCVKWGGDWPMTSDRKILGPSFSAVPSATFGAALNTFEKFYGMPLSTF